MRIVGENGPVMSVGAVAMGVLLVSVCSGPARASCNAIPPAMANYRGAVGSIDRPFLSPDPGEVITIRPACGSPAFTVAAADGSMRALMAGELLVSAVFKRSGQAAELFFIAGDGKCEGLVEPVCCLERLFCPPAPRCVTGAEVSLALDPSDGAGAVRFLLPDTGFAGPVTLAITKVGQAPPRELARLRCADIKRPDLLACFDDIVPAEPGSCEPLRLGAVPALGSAADAAGPCDPAPTPGPPPSAPGMQLVALPPSNDYQSVCSRDDGNPPPCKGNADRVRYTVDSAGTVDVPFFWANSVRQKPGQPGVLDRRAVSGSTAVEASLGVTGQITIPSAAFLETVSHQGGTFIPRPLFEPTVRLDRPNELNVRGTADKPKSVLRFFPRRAWAYVCDGGQDGGQACEPGVDPGACRGGVCGPYAQARYFFCAGGARDRLPCTSRLQCPGESECRAGSICYQPLGGPTTKECSTDNDCGTGRGLECGRGLFEFRDRVNKQGVGTVTRSAGFGESGVCADGGAAACSGPLPCLPGFASCVRYRAEAEGYQP